MQEGESETMIIDDLTKMAVNATFTHDALIINLLEGEADTRALILKLENYFAIWAKAMDKKFAVIRSQLGETKIPASLAVPFSDIVSTTDEPIRLLWFANTAVSPGLLVIANDLMNNPRKAGVVRLSDELQVIQSDANKILNPGHTMQESCNWTRSQFWHPQDLIDFRRDCQQQLNPDGSNFIEFTWRSFDPILGMNNNTPGNWLEFSTRYRLYDGADGDFYQVCDNLDMKEIL